MVYFVYHWIVVVFAHRLHYEHVGSVLAIRLWDGLFRGRIDSRALARGSHGGCCRFFPFLIRDVRWQGGRVGHLTTTWDTAWEGGDGQGGIFAVINFRTSECVMMTLRVTGSD
jgi:hypothetical protein